MAKHLLIWRIDQTRVPADPKERGASWGALLSMVESDLERGAMKDWGVFPGENRGYCTFEGSNLELMKTTQQYSPYVLFETHPVGSIMEAKELVNALKSHD